jgi:hypothetical protein
VAQTFFAIALGAITVFIACFAVFVLSTTVWADRWVRKQK